MGERKRGIEAGRENERYTMQASREEKVDGETQTSQVLRRSARVVEHEGHDHR